MNCTLKIKDPSLSYYLGQTEFDSYEQFRNKYENRIRQGLVPVGNLLEQVFETVQGDYVVKDTTFDSIDSLIDHALGGLLDDNDPDLQFNKFVQTFDIYNQKYHNESFIDDSDKTKDFSFLNSLIDFYTNFPVSEEFKQSNLYGEFLGRVKDLENLFTREKITVEDELPTNEATLSEKPGEHVPYIYSVARVYEPTIDNVSKNLDPLAILRHNFSKTIDNLRKEGRRFFIRLEKDGVLNSQTKSVDWLSQNNIPFGVVGVVYEMVGSDMKRVYIEDYDTELDSDVKITTDSKKAKRVGANEVVNFTLTIPDFSKKQYFNVNPEVRSAFITVRDKVNQSGESSPLYEINDLWQEYPVAAKYDSFGEKKINSDQRQITLEQFLDGQEGDLRINSTTEGINYAGNLYVQFPKGKTVLDRTPLSEEWVDKVVKLVEYDYSNELDQIDDVVFNLNKLLDFKGGDIFFFRRPGATKISIVRKSKPDENGIFQRVKEEISLKQLRSTLKYARINVYKQWLDNANGTFPVVTTKGIRPGVVNWYEFYTKHHKTIARQIKIGDKYYFEPIKSLMFDLKSTESVELEKVSKQLENPKLGNLDLVPEQPIDTKEIITNLQSIINSVEGSTKDILQILNELLKNEEVQNRLEGSTVVFTTSLDANKKEYGGVKGKDIIVSWGIITNPNLMGDVLAHEIIHTLTSDWIHSNLEDTLVQELDKLLEQAQQSIPDYNATRYEILPALSNPELAKKLQGVEIKDKSLYDRIVDIIKEIITKVFGLENFQKGQPNLYKELVVKLIEISTKQPTIKKEQKEPDIWEGLDLNNLSFDGTDSLPIFGYNKESLKAVLGNKKPSYLKKVIDSLDADVFQGIYNSGELGKFVAGKLDFINVFARLFNSYLNYVKQNKDELSKSENSNLKDYLLFVLTNKEFLQDYWIQNTNTSKIRKPKKGEQDQGTKLEPQEEQEVDKDKSMEENEVDSMVDEGGNEEKIGIERGTDTASIEAADPLSRVFVKMIPKIEREKGLVKYYNENQVNSKDFVRVPGTNKFVKYKRNELGRIELCDYTPTWNFIAKELKDMLSLEEMLNHIKNTGGNNKLVDRIPEILVFAERIDKPIENEFDAELRSKLETSFKRAGVGVYIILDNEGTLSVINESEDISQSSKRMFNDAIVASLETILKPYEIKQGDDQGKLDFKKFLIDRGYIKDNEPNTLDKDLFKELGLFLHPETTHIKGNKTEQYQEFEKKFIQFIIDYNKPVPIGLADFIVKDVKGTNIQGLNNYFKKLFELEHKNRPLATSTMVPNAKGEKMSTLSVFNSILQYRKHYNDAKTIEELNELIPRTKNDMFNYSLTKSLMFQEVENNGVFETRRTDKKLLVDILSGWKTVRKGKASEGTLTIDLPIADWIRLNFVGMLKEGKIENTRAETASTSYYTKLSSYSTTNEKKKTPFSYIEVSSSYKVEDKTVNLTEDSPILNVWTNYLQGELSRIKKQVEQGKAVKWGLFNDILNKDEKEQVFNQTNLKEFLKAPLDRFFTQQFKIYDKLFEQEMGGFETIASFQGNEIKGDVELYNKVYTKDGQSKLNQWKLFFVINALTLHVEETILFQGDLSQTPKYFKRAKGVQSTGTPLSKDKELIKFVNDFLSKYSFAQLIGASVEVGDTYTSATIKDDVKESFYTKDNKIVKDYILSKKLYNEKAGLSQTDKEIEQEAVRLLVPVDEKGKKGGYLATNIGDGGGFINPDFYFNLLQRVGNINQDQIKAFKALMLDAKKNASKYKLGQDQKLTQEEEKIMQEGLDLIAKGKVLFPLLKVTYRSNSLSAEVVQSEIMDKFALFPLFPQFTYDKPAAHHALLQMMKEGKAYVKFESGTKVDNHNITDFLSKVESGDFGVTFEDSQHTLQSEYLREQIKTPTKSKEKNTFGTQFRKLVTAILDVYLRNKWDKLNQQFSQRVKKEVLGEFGITQTNGKWDFSNVNKAKVAKVLLKEAKKREMPQNILTYFEKYLEHQKNPDLNEVYEFFESSFGSQAIQNLLASVIKKISIQKLKGSQLKQIPQSLFDKENYKGSRGTRDLKFYRIENGVVKEAECKIGMMGDFKNLLNLEDVTKLVDPNNDNELTRTEILNKLLEDDQWVEDHKDVLTVIGYRIPTQGFNSMEVMIVREFLPSFYGDTVVVPPEMTVQSGTDFDYDKLPSILPSIDKDGKLITKGSYGIQNEMIKTAKDMLLGLDNFHKLVTPNDNSLVFDLLKGKGGKKGLLGLMEISNEDPKTTQIVTFEGNVKKTKAVKGKGLLGIAAVWNPFTVLLQNHKWKLNDRYIKSVGFRGETVSVSINPVLGGSLDSSKPLTEDGVSKLEIISQLINVTVDMPSDDTFGQTIFGKNDFASLVYSISMLGCSFETAMKFFHQPIIWKFKEEVEKNKKRGLTENLSKLMVIAELLGLDVPVGKDGTPNYTKFELSLYDKLSDLEKDIDPSKFDTGLENVKDFRTINYSNSVNQKAVLAHYFKLLDQSSAIRTVQSALNFDTSPDNNLQKAFDRLKNYQQGVDSGIIDKSLIDSIRNDSVISGLYVSDILESLSEQLFPILLKGNKGIFSSVSEDYGKNKERAFQKITNSFLLSLVQNFGQYNNKNIFDFAIPYLYGDKKTFLVEEGRKLKQKYNYRLLNILLSDISSKRTPVIFNPQIYMGMENSPEDKNKLTEEWQELLSNPETKEFAEVLAIVGLIQSGWSKSPVYFSDIIPEEFVTPLINKAFKEYEKLSDISKLAYKDMFVSNFVDYESGTLGKKETKKRKFLKEPFRLMNYTYGVKQALEDAAKEEQQLLEVTPQEQFIENIYSQLGSKTQSENIIIKSLQELSNKGGILPDGSINALRNSNSDEHFGNPFDSKNTNQTVRTGSTKESVIKYIDWVLNSQDSRADWIRKQIQSGVLKNKPIYYYKELEEPSHATALDWLINNSKSPVTEQSQPEDEYLDFVGTLSQPKTQDEFKYYGAMYTIELKDGKAVDVVNLKQSESETNKKFQERKNKIINAYNTNPDVDPQNGKPFRNVEQPVVEQKPVDSVLFNNIEFSLIEGYFMVRGEHDMRRGDVEITYYLFDKDINVLWRSNSDEGYDDELTSIYKKLSISKENFDGLVSQANTKKQKTQDINEYILKKREEKASLNKKPVEEKDKVESFYQFKDDYKVPTKFVLNADQKNALEGLEEFINSKETTITLSGAAGTGKSTLISIFNQWLSRKKYIYPKYSAPTHRANAVTKLMNPTVSVYTLHQLFGLSPDIDLEEGNFDVKELEFAKNNLPKLEYGDVLIIDESSMISDSLYEFIQKEQQKNNIRVVYVGDVAQLKPVKQKDKSKVFTSTSHKVISLTKVERTSDNAVLEESVNVRQGNDWNYQTKLNDKEEGVVYVKSRAELLEIAKDAFETQSLIENKLYFRILSATNKAVQEVNTLVRKVLYNEGSDNQLVEGDIIMGYDNFDYDYRSGQYKLYNGGDYEVVNIKPDTRRIQIDDIDQTFNGYFVTIKNLLDSNEKPYSLFVADKNEPDEKAIVLADKIQALQKEGAKQMKIGNRKEGAELFNTATKLKNKVAFMKDIEKYDPVSKTTKTIIKKTFDYGYAHTIHKSQGGTYDKVMILADTINSFKDPISQQELKYVSVSRARKTAYIRTDHELKSPQVEPKTDMSQLVNHSGGALGADSEWDNIGKEFGMINNKHYYYKDKTPKGNVEITKEQFDEGIKKANKAAQATYGFKYSFSDNKVGRLLSRNWQQVKNSDAIFAIGKIIQKGEKPFNDDRIALKPMVSGGTGYAVEMAIQENKPVFMFDQNKNQWFTWNNSDFVQIETPILTKNFAGIGTREINEQGKQAIRDVYQKTLEQGVQQIEPKTEKTDNQLIREYIDKVSTGQIVPDWFRMKVPVNFDKIREHQSIPNLVQSIKNRITELSQKVEQYEREGTDQKVIDNVNNQIQGYGSLVYDLENLRQQPGQQTLFGYNQESLQAKEIQISYGSEDTYLESLKRINQQRGRISWDNLFRNYSRFPQRIKNAILRSETVRKDFREITSNNTFGIGRRVDNIQDIVDLYLIHRSPFIEKLHFVYLKDGEIVATHASTAGLVNSTGKFDEHLFVDTYKSSGADSVYVLHNHPSGNHLPSDADLAMTYQITKKFPDLNFKGQLIIDTDKFTFVVATKDMFKMNDYQEIDYKRKPDLLFKTRIQLGKSIKEINQSLKQIGDIILKNANVNSVIYLDTFGSIVGHDAFTSKDMIDFEKQMKQKGAYSYVVFSPTKEDNDIVESMTNHIKGYSSFYLNNNQVISSLRFEQEFLNQITLNPNQIQFWEKTLFNTKVNQESKNCIGL